MTTKTLVSTRSFVICLWIGVVGVLAALAFTVLNASSVHAVPPYPWEKKGDFAWEASRAATYGEWHGLNEGTRTFLESQGIRCEGAVCRPSGERPIPVELDLSGRDLRNLTFKDLHVGNIKSNATDLSNTRFENFRMDGTWEATELTARNLVIEGTGQSGNFESFGRFNAEWTQVNAEGMHLSRVELVDTYFDRVKARDAQVTDAMISNESLREFITSAVKDFPANIIVETYRTFGENQQVEGLLAPGKYEGLNFEGSHMQGSLKNVELIDANLKNLEVVVSERPQAARWDQAWENVTIKEGTLENAKFDLLNARNLKIDADFQDNMEINSRELVSNLQVKGIAHDFKLRGNYENTDLRELTTANAVREAHLANLPHLFSRGELSQLGSESTFFDTSGSHQKNLLLPANISGSKISNTEFSNTKFPDGLRARGVEAIGTQFRADAGNVVGKGVDFSQSQLKDIDFNGQKLRDANFGQATLDGVKLDNVSLAGSTVFDQAKVINLDAANARLDDGSHLSAMGTFWESIKKFFGFGTNSTMELARSTIEGQLDLTGMSTGQLAKVNWSGTRFAPNSEIIFKDVDTLVDSLPRLLGQHSTNTIQNLRIATVDERGETIYVIKDGQSLSKIAERLSDLHVSRTAAEHFEKLAKAALDATNPAAEKVRRAQAEYESAQYEYQQKSKDPRFMDLELTWNKLNHEHEIAQRRYEEYVSSQETYLRRLENTLKELVPEALGKTRDHMDRLLDRVVDLKWKMESGEDVSKAELQKAQDAVSAYMESVSSFKNKDVRDIRYSYEELMRDKREGWPSDLKKNVEDLADKLERADSRLEKYSKTYNSNLNKARQVLEQKREELERAVESHSQTMEQAKFLNETKELAEGTHAKNVRSDHQEFVTETNKEYESALTEANSQVEELKSQLEIARQDVAEGEATRDTARLRAEEATKAYETLKEESVKLTEEKQSHQSQMKEARSELLKLKERISVLEKDINDREKLLKNEFSEQESDGALAREARTQINEFEAELKASKSKQAELTQTFDKAKENFDATSEKLAQVDSKLDGAKSRMDVRKGSLNHVEEVLREARSRVQDAEAKQATVQQQIDEVIAAREQDRPLVKDHPLVKSAAERAEKDAAKAEADLKNREAAEKTRAEYLNRLERERAEKEARERAEKEARERAERENRERIEKEARERAELENRQRVERENRERQMEQERLRQEQERIRQEQERVRQEQARQIRERANTR